MPAVRSEMGRAAEPGLPAAASSLERASQRPAFGAAAFRRAAVSLLTDPPESDAARQNSADAAAQLVAWAAAGDPRLAAVLHPDPSDPGPVTWTVACYQIGDLSPTTLRDFAEASEAVAAFVHCEDAAHVAAELLASTSSGLRWTAMVRTGELVRFQVLGPETASDAAAGDRGVGEARRRWADHLPSLAATPLPEVPAAPLPASAQPAEVGEILEQLRRLDQRVDSLVAAHEISERLQALEQRVADLQLQLGLTSSIVAAAGSRDAEPISPFADGVIAAYCRRLAAARSRVTAAHARRRLIAARSRALPAAAAASIAGSRRSADDPCPS